MLLWLFLQFTEADKLSEKIDDTGWLVSLIIVVLAGVTVYFFHKNTKSADRERDIYKNRCETLETENKELNKQLLDISVDYAKQLNESINTLKIFGEAWKNKQ